MANGINKVIILGRVGKDPEVRYSPSGLAIASFSLATTEKWKDKQTGEFKESTEWHNITAFNKLAEIAGQYAAKGDLVYVEGKIKTEKYQKDGADRYVTKIIADQIQLLGGKKSGDVIGDAEKSHLKPSTEPGSSDFKDDDIPF